jgi:hypothetical protein
MTSEVATIPQGAAAQSGSVIDLSHARREAPVTVSSEPGELLQIVNALQRSGQPIDPSAVRELYAIQREIMADKRAARLEQLELVFNEALARCESEIGRVVADKENTQTHSWYATYAAIDRHIRPIYTKHGFSLSFDEEESPKPEHVRVVCFVSNGGFTRKYHRDMPADGKGAKGGDVMTKTHAVGSAFEYGRRYLVKGIFNIAIGKDPDDDDGNGAGSAGEPETNPDPTEGGKYITAKQAADMMALLTEIKADIPTFLRWNKAEHIGRIKAANYKPAMAAIEERRRNM